MEKAALFETKAKMKVFFEFFFERSGSEGAREVKNFKKTLILAFGLM